LNAEGLSGPKMLEVAQEWRKQYNNEFYCWQNVVKVFNEED
jgi:hypothetical protein